MNSSAGVLRFLRSERQEAADMPNPSSACKTAVVLIVLTVWALGGILATVLLFKYGRSRLATTEAPPLMRLPKTLLPHSYRLILQPHLHTRVTGEQNKSSYEQMLRFDGASVVRFRCVEKTRTIYLHSKDLWITNPPAVVNQKTNVSVKVTQTVFHNDESDFMEILLEEPLEEGEDYSLGLTFWGELSETSAGLYWSTYEEGGEENANVVRFLAATHCAATMARAVFPCFDEPDMKAVFNVTIVHRKDTCALANGQQQGKTIKGDWQYTTFYPTPKMSTYLFAFTVSEFTSKISTTHNDVKIYTFARPEATSAGHTQYATDISGRILKFFEGYFGIDYPQKTLKQIALLDMDFAGMENWGLITYQEDGLLYEENVSSQLQKVTIATLIAHEMAHQWFGNLVTMKWWNQIWLNEGFATYMTIIAVDHIEPTFKMNELYYLHELHSAFEADTLASSHPLNPPEAEIQSPTDIADMFDNIAYSKGASVLRMLADYVGEDVFHEGVKKYLSDFSFRNPEQHNLWDCIQNNHPGVTDIATLMDSWTSQTGYPVITINTSNGEIYQKPFMSNDSSEPNVWWQIPIRVMSRTSDISLIKLTSKTPVKKNELISKNGEWILANVNCTGYYRVNYDPENWERLLTQLETDRNLIPLMNRGQLIDDAFNLARAKYVDVTLALNATRFLRNETEYVPWEAAARNLRYFILMLERTEVYGPMQTYLRKQAEVLYDYFSSYTDNFAVPREQSSQLSQLTGVEVACSNGLPQCLAMASKMFAEWMASNENRIHPNLRPVIYCRAVAAGGIKEWKFAWEKLQTTNSTIEKDRLLRALSCTTKVYLLNRYLQHCLDPEKISLVDVATVISTVAQNVVGYKLAWNFIRQHWEYISEGDMVTVIMSLTSRISQHIELQELERFATERGLVYSNMTSLIERAQVNIQWATEHKNVILDWLIKQT